MIAKYIVHARQTSANVWQRPQSLRHCRTFCQGGINKRKMSHKEDKEDTEKYLPGAPKDRQSTEGRSNILPGNPELIFKITAFMKQNWGYLDGR